ncbi:signal transduction histidine kinase [Desulfuromonas versatilis]|uniref:histidine kinase n=1 Tax=Desulfuromonas versatilis TaxID=2802975 RepID=A0ABM8HXV6_9BACT|nr:ATP-binding protein [Desulfuromonas versatilis]BCR05364.1 signal transduction histidine kinase [Desulfuromonas versatilis]
MQPTILIADDDRFIRQVLKDLLQGFDYATLEAGDGEQALSLARTHHPEVILLDLVMPGLNGLDVCRRLRVLPEFKYTLILLMTARSDLEASVNPFQAGADDYLAKPLDGSELVARIQGGLLKCRALETLDRKARDYEAMLDVASSVSASIETSDILRQVSGKITQLLEGVDGGTTALVQEDGRGGYVLSTSDDPNLAGLRIFLDHSPTIRKVIETGKALVVEGEGAPQPGGGGRGGGGSEKETTLAFPVRCARRVAGALVARLQGTRGDFSGHELNLCQKIIDASANALRNAQQFRQLREESELLRSAKRQVEEELSVKDIYEQLFECASEGLIAFNPAAEAVFANRAALEILDVPRDRLPGFNLASVLDKKSLRRVLTWQKQDAEDVLPNARFDVAVRTARGQQRLLSLSLSRQAIRGELRVAAIREVTEKRRLEQELRDARADLQQVNEKLRLAERERAEYLNAAVHDLKVPVTILSGYCSLLQEVGTDNLTGEQKEFLEAALASSDRLVELVNNILDLSRFEAGKMVLEIAQHDLCGALREACRDMPALAAAQDLQFEVSVPERCSALFDTECLHRVIVNLVGNAVKFTRPGGRIRVVLHDLPTEARVMVEDSGAGIPAHLMSRLFEPFSQLYRDEARRGSGLGLSICKKIIDAHGGRIWAESTVGRGTRFFFTLPKQGS